MMPWLVIAHIWLWWLGAPVLCCFVMVFTVVPACLCIEACMCATASSAIAVPTSELEAGEDSSAPDVEMGALKAAEDNPENDSERPPDKLATAIS